MNQKIKRLENGIYVMVDDTHLSRWVEEHGRLDNEHGYLEGFRKYIPEGGTVIDCGTCIGDHTVTYASMVGPTGMVLGFEANPDVAECCALNLGIYPWAKVYNVGLSDDYGVAGIDINPNVGASRLTAKGREVHLSPLDHYLPMILTETNRVDFIKMDIEGFEPRALKGAEAIIQRFHPVMLIEVNRAALEAQGNTPEGIFELLSVNGYSWEPTDRNHSKEQYDVIALPQGRA